MYNCLRVAGAFLGALGGGFEIAGGAGFEGKGIVLLAPDGGTAIGPAELAGEHAADAGREPFMGPRGIFRREQGDELVVRSVHVQR